MGWIQATFELAMREPEALADALLECGAVSIDMTDADAGTADERPLFGEPGAAEQIWRRQKITALFDEAVAADALIRTVLSSLDLQPLGDIAIAGVADQDWVLSTQQQFEPIQVSERMWIVPTWCEPPNPRALNLRLDPGLAFGTGSHPTTWQCLRWLEANLPKGARVLDYGCGSGVLAIAAKKLGAGRVLGVDIDPPAVRATLDNACANGVEVEAIGPDQVPAERFDVVVANILSNPLKVLAPLLADFTAPRGSIVLAGILDTQADEVARCYRPWFEMTTYSDKDGWACITGRRIG